MKVNTHNLKLVGTYEISGELKIDDEVTFEITADVVKKEEKSLQNGEIDVTYVLKSVEGPINLKATRDE